VSQKATVIIPPVQDPTTGLPPGYVSTGAGYLNCSPEANAARLAQIDALRQQLYGGVSSVGDRGRSVTYRSNSDIVQAIQGLQAELSFCTTGAWPRAGGIRSFVIPQVKGL
jgi:hypothetical protein